MVVLVELPVLVTFFNRPDTLNALLSKISSIKGLNLFFASDGPKSHQDKSNVEECWKLVKLWFPDNPESQRLIRSTNRGCKLAMKENMDWFFSQNPYGVILEDDCSPHHEFFTQMYQVLRDPTMSKFMTVSGGNYLGESFASPRLSVFPMIWGWGTWSQNWKLYSLEISDAKDIINFPIKRLWNNQWSLNEIFFRDNFSKRFSEVERGQLDTWDYSLTASSWRHKKLNLHLGGNLVINSGFNSLATHTIYNPPSWVPLNYSIQPLELNSIDEYSPILDKQLARIVFGCTFKSFFKNQIKRIVFQ